MRRLSRPPPPLLPVISCTSTIDSVIRSIMVARNRNTIWPAPPQLSLHRRAALSTNSNGTQSAHKGKRGGGLDTILMSMGQLWAMEKSETVSIYNLRYSATVTFSTRAFFSGINPANRSLNRLLSTFSMWIRFRRSTLFEYKISEIKVPGF
jgi:hypothetical protein